MKSFIENAARNVSANVASVLGAKYLPWATAWTLAGRPGQTVALTSNGQVIHEIFGGAVVAVDMALPSGKIQRTWLPVLNPKNQPIDYAGVTSRTAHDTVQRCRVKALATCHGVGMSLYVGFNGDGDQFVQAMNIGPDTDLSKVQALASQKIDPKTGKVLAIYLDWAVALAAARMTDPDFYWEVGRHPNMITGETDALYLQVNNTFMVSVNLTYKGVTHTEYLPVMGTLPVQTSKGIKNMDYQPLVDPTASDWNRAVMRCLAKGIAVLTGYGLSLYANEDLTDLDGERPESEQQAAPQRQQRQTQATAATTQQQPASTSQAQSDKADSDKADPAVIGRIRELLRSAGKAEAAICSWLGVTSLNEASPEQAAKGLDVLLLSAEAKAKAKAV